MTRYHITEDGPKPCSATIQCPLEKNGDIQHINGKANAQKYYEKKLAQKHNITQTLNKNNKFLEPIIIPQDTKKDIILQDFEKTLDTMNCESHEEHTNFLTHIVNGEIPEEMPTESQSNVYSMLPAIFHTYLTEAGYYGKITKKVAQDIAKNIGHGTILDPMAGKGYFAKAMRETGVKTIASDDNSWNISTQIEQLDAIESLKKYGNNITHVVISWAPYESNIDEKILDEIRTNYPHITIINIGEYAGGCTGSENFWDKAKIIEPKYNINYTTTYGIHDNITFVR